MKFYRYEDVHYEDGPRIQLYEFDLLRETPKGYWIIPKYTLFDVEEEEDKIWVSKTARKRYAYPTKEEALEGFYHRKRRYAEILRSRLSATEYVLDMIEDMRGVKSEPCVKKKVTRFTIKEVV